MLWGDVYTGSFIHWKVYVLYFYAFLILRAPVYATCTVAGQYLLVLRRKSRYSQERNHLYTEIRNNLAVVQKRK